MKKITRTLTLRRETLRDLSHQELRRAEGAGQVTGPCSFGCPHPTQSCTVLTTTNTSIE